MRNPRPTFATLSSWRAGNHEQTKEGKFYTTTCRDDAVWSKSWNFSPSLAVSGKLCEVSRNKILPSHLWFMAFIQQDCGDSSAEHSTQRVFCRGGCFSPVLAQGEILSNSLVLGSVLTQLDTRCPPKLLYYPFFSWTGEKENVTKDSSRSRKGQGEINLQPLS